MKGLSYNKNKPTWKKRRVLSAFGHFFFVVAFQVLLEEKSQRKKYKAFFTFPGSKYLTMNKIYITLPPLLSLFFWPMLSGMTNNSKVKKCLIVGTHLPNGKVHQGEGREQGKKKNHPKEQPYGIDIRQEAMLWNHSFWRGKRIGTNSFKQKLLWINLTGPLMQV